MRRQSRRSAPSPGWHPKVPRRSATSTCPPRRSAPRCSAATPNTSIPIPTPASSATSRRAAGVCSASSWRATVTPGGTAIYWFKAGNGVFPATGPGLVCGEVAQLAADTTTEINVTGTLATPATADAARASGAVAVHTYACAADAETAAVDWFSACRTRRLRGALHPLHGGPDQTRNDRRWRHRTQRRDPVRRPDTGHLQLDAPDTVWCHAESDNVNDRGELVVTRAPRSRSGSFSAVRRRSPDLRWELIVPSPTITSADAVRFLAATRRMIQVVLRATRARHDDPLVEVRTAQQQDAEADEREHPVGGVERGEVHDEHLGRGQAQKPEAKDARGPDPPGDADREADRRRARPRGCSARPEHASRGRRHPCRHRPVAGTRRPPRRRAGRRQTPRRPPPHIAPTTPLDAARPPSQRHTARAPKTAVALLQRSG